MQVEKRFKWIWADHGDDISMQYAGTGALKSGFTRTGRQQPSACHSCHGAFLQTILPARLREQRMPGLLSPSFVRRNIIVAKVQMLCHRGLMRAALVGLCSC